MRVLTYPGWMKDSVLFTLSRLRGSCFSVNKPSLPKLKFLLNNSTKVLGLNEVQQLELHQKLDLAKFYEDTGDFKTQYINPTRGTKGTTEICKINNMSTLTFSNFPDSKKSYESQKEEIFDNIFDPKIRSRIFPLLFKGGTETIPACKQRFEHLTTKLDDVGVIQITNWLRNHIFYENNGYRLANKKDFKNKYIIQNNRWDRNFQSVCERLKLYSNSQGEFDRWTALLYSCHNEYLDFVNKGLVSNYVYRDKEESVVEFDKKCLVYQKCVECFETECNMGADGKPYCKDHFKG